MRALTFHGVGDVRCETVADPSIEAPGDALVRVRVAGLCGSDLHVYHGRETGLDAGTVLGHELVGEVVETGPEVRAFAAGDLVLSPFSTSCGTCFYCRRGLTARCESGELFGWVEGGRGLQGAQAELVRVPLAETTLLKVPEGLAPEVALLAGDVLATGFFAAVSGEVGPGVVTAVIGCGAVGLTAVAAARRLGAERVLAIDGLAERVRLAARLGGEPVDAGVVDPLAVVREATGGRGADAVLEAVGSPQATRLAVDLVRPGGTVAAVGVHTEPHFAFAPGEAYDKNLTYRAGRCSARIYAERALELAAGGAADLAAVLTHQFPLAEGAAAYDLFAHRRDGCIKVIFRP